MFVFLYILSSVLLALYGFHSLYLTWQYGRGKGLVTPAPALDQARPRVTVQLPIYNERHVVARLLAAVTDLDWPRDRLQIQVLDDSTDDTSAMIEALVERYRTQDVWIEHIRRVNRQGYKAGALACGLASAAGEYIAIFDADFLPAPDFLRRTLPAFADSAVGCVQGRWVHINPDSSWLTRAQALGIDGHFTVEHNARQHLHAFINFNGTGGVWRRRCIDDAGGWQCDTLTEDLDLSYRAQLRGWRVRYLPGVEVPAELPVQVDAFKRQQFRWAKGSLQAAAKLLPRLWRAPLPWRTRLLATLHLTAYSVHALMVLNLLLLLPITFSHSTWLLLTPALSLAALGPPLMYWLTLKRRTDLSPAARLIRLGLLSCIGFGLSASNGRAVCEALLGIPSAFKRTPKFAVSGRDRDWQTSVYALPRDPNAWIELALAIYAFVLLFYALFAGIWWLLGWLSFYAAGYGYMAYMTFSQAWQRRRAIRGQTSQQYAAASAQ